MDRTSVALYNPSDQVEREMCHDIAQKCLKNSSYDLTSGGRGGDFFDIDEYTTSNSAGAENGQSAAEKARKVAELCAKKIEELKLKGTEIDRLAFTERDSGPVGMITYKDLIETVANMETCIIRPRKRLLRSALKGRPFDPGERVALISDVATSGDTIHEAAEKIWSLGGTVSCALVLYDRLEGAREYLSLYDIDLVPIFDRIKFEEENLIDPKDTQTTNVMQLIGVGTTR